MESKNEGWLHERGKKGTPWVTEALRILALGLAVVMAAAGTWHSAAAAQAASGAAVLELARGAARTQSLAAGELGQTVIPLGRAVGIKMFADGVMVVGLSDIQTDGGPCLRPAPAACGRVTSSPTSTAQR